MTVKLTSTDLINSVVVVNPNPVISRVAVQRSQVSRVLAGAPGIDGTDPTVISRPAATNLSGHRAVATNASGEFVYADKDTPEHAQSTIGITTGAAIQGAQATAIALGPLTEPSWSWTPQQLVFLGSNGVLTQTAPTTGFLLVVGKAVTPTTIFVAVQPAINRS